MVVAYLRITINQLERRCPLNRRKQEVGKVVGGQLGPVYRLDRDLEVDSFKDYIYSMVMYHLQDMVCYV